MQALVPGMSSNTDSGGINGTMTGGAGSIHGGRGNDSRTLSDGNNTGWAGGSAGGGNTPNVAGAQEVVLTTSGGLGEAETAGVILNVIPRDGGNNFSGQFSANGANGSMQGSNYTQSLKDQGLKTPSELLKVYDINPMGGGRIVRDKLWFYLTYRQTGGQRTVPGMWINKNAGNPNAWTVDFDKNKPAFDDNLERNGIGRITWQVSPRNKISAHWSEQYTASSINGGGTGTVTPEASTYTLFQPSHINSASWSSPISGRLLLEAGWGSYQSRYRNPGPRVDGTFNPRMIRRADPGRRDHEPELAAVRGRRRRLQSSFDRRAGAQPALALVRHGRAQHEVRVSGRLRQSEPDLHLLQRSHPGPDQRRQGEPADPGRVQRDTNIKIVRNLIPTSFYGQDQWTTGRLTLQGGIRYDHLITNYPDQSFGGPGYNASAPTRSCIRHGRPRASAGATSAPGTGAAYDLFGNGKTAVKFNLGKYMEAFSATNTDLDLNPLIRNTISTTRTWTDERRLRGELQSGATRARTGNAAAMDNQNFGTANFTRSYDTDFVTGYGKRPYNWGLGLSVQQEVLPRVSVNVGYFRNWWGNWYVVDNTSTVASDYTPFSIVAPVDPRLEQFSGQVVSGLYNLVPGKVGQVNELAQSAERPGQADRELAGRGRERRRAAAQRHHGAGRHEHRAPPPGRVRGAGGVAGARRRRHGGVEQLHRRDGRRQRTMSPLSVANPYCRVVEPYLTRVQRARDISGPQSDPPGERHLVEHSRHGSRGELHDNDAILAGMNSPQPLGRKLSSADRGNNTVNLIAPATLYAPRRNNLDFRVAKILRYGRTRTQIGVDVYNATNTDTPTTYNMGYTGPTGSWLTPTAIQPARYAKISAQFDF